MKGICHENKIRRSGKFRNIVGVTGDEVAIRYATFGRGGASQLPKNLGSISIAETCRATFEI